MDPGTSVSWILTVSTHLPPAMLDELLTSTQETLLAHGARRVWVDASRPELAIMAELPARDGVLRAPDEDGTERATRSERTGPRT